VPEYGALATYQGALLYSAAAGGDPELAVSLLAGLAADDFAAVPRSVEWLAAMAMVCDACVRLGSTDHAAALYRSYSTAAATTARVGPMAGWWGPVDHHLGALCRLLGQAEQAQVHLDRALALSEAMAAPTWQARTRIELARLRLDAGDDTGAAELAAPALETAERLGCTGIAAEARLVGA
jgi:hypothetical protein